MLCSLQIHECRRINTWYSVVDIYRDDQVSETDAVLVNKTKAGISFCLTWARFLAGSWIARIFRISAIKRYKCFQLGSKLAICWSSCLLNEASLKLAIKIWFVPCGMFQFSCYPHVFDNVLLFVTPIPKTGEYSLPWKSSSMAWWEIAPCTQSAKTKGSALNGIVPVAKVIGFVLLQNVSLSIFFQVPSNFESGI